MPDDDPRLLSIHLDGSRRELFRRARELLLRARGSNTLGGKEFGPNSPEYREQFTMNVCPDQVDVPAGTKFCLMDKDRAYPLKIGFNVVGRSSESDVCVKDAYVSRRHCAVLVHSDGHCELHDIASKNGTFLNGSKLTCPTRLHAGDEIRMCDVQLIFLTCQGEESSQFAKTLVG